MSPAQATRPRPTAFELALRRADRAVRRILRDEASREFPVTRDARADR